MRTYSSNTTVTTYMTDNINGLNYKKEDMTRARVCVPRAVKFDIQ